MRIGDAESCRGNFLNGCGRMSGDAEHLSPTVVGRKNCGDAGIDYTGYGANFVRELIGEASDGSWIRIANAGNKKMSLEDMILANAERLTFEPHYALNQQTCANQKHQGHGHFDDDQNVAHTEGAGTRSCRTRSEL